MPSQIDKIIQKDIDQLNPKTNDKIKADAFTESEVVTAPSTDIPKQDLTMSKSDVFGTGLEYDYAPMPIGTMDDTFKPLVGKDLYDAINEDREYTTEEKDSFVAMYLADTINDNYETLDRDIYADEMYGTTDLDTQFDKTKLKMQVQYGESQIERFDKLSLDDKLSEAKKWFDKNHAGESIFENDLLDVFRKNIVAKSAQNNIKWLSATLDAKANRFVDAVIAHDDISDEQYSTFAEFDFNTQQKITQLITLRSPKLATGYAGRLWDAVTGGITSAGEAVVRNVTDVMSQTVNEPRYLADIMLSRNIDINKYFDDDGNVNEEGIQFLWDLRMEEHKGEPELAQAQAYGQTKPSVAFANRVAVEYPKAKLDRAKYKLDQALTKKYAKVEDDGILGWIGELPIKATGVIPDLTVTIGANYVVPGSGLAYMFSRTHGSIATTLKYDYNVDPKVAFEMGAISSALITSVEHLQLGKLVPNIGLKKMKGTIQQNSQQIKKIFADYITKNATLKSYLKDAGIEGTQESLQSIIETATNLVGLYGYSKDADGQKYDQAVEMMTNLLKEIPENYGIMAIISGGSKSIDGGVVKYNTNQINRLIADAVLSGEIDTITKLNGILDGANVSKEVIKTKMIEAIKAGAPIQMTEEVYEDDAFNDIKSGRLDDLANDKARMQLDSNESIKAMVGDNVEIEDAVNSAWERAEGNVDTFKDLLSGGKYDDLHLDSLVYVLQERDATLAEVYSDIDAQDYDIIGNDVSKLLTIDHLKSDDVMTTVKSVVPDADVTISDDNNIITVALPNGANVNISISNDITDRGNYIPYKSLINLNKGTATTNTINHELFHHLETTVLSDADIAILAKSGLDTVEKRAEAFADYIDNSGAQNNTKFNKIKKFIRSITDNQNIADVYDRARLAQNQNMTVYHSADVMLQADNKPNDTSLDKQHRASVALAYDIKRGNTTMTDADAYLKQLSVDHGLNLNKSQRNNIIAHSTKLQTRIAVDGIDTLGGIYKMSNKMQAEDIVKSVSPDIGLQPSRYIRDMIIPKYRKIANDIQARTKTNKHVGIDTLDPTDLTIYTSIPKVAYDKEAVEKQLNALKKSKNLGQKDKDVINKLVGELDAIGDGIPFDAIPFDAINKLLRELVYKVDEITKNTRRPTKQLRSKIDQFLGKENLNPTDIANYIDALDEYTDAYSGDNIKGLDALINDLNAIKSAIKGVTGLTLDKAFDDYVDGVFDKAEVKVNGNGKKANLMAVATITKDLRNLIRDTDIPKATRVKLRQRLPLIKTKKSAKKQTKYIVGEVTKVSQKITKRQYISDIKKLVSTKEVNLSAKVTTEAHRRKIEANVAQRLRRLEAIMIAKSTTKLEEYGKLVEEINSNYVPENVNDADAWRAMQQDRLEEFALVGSLSDMTYEKVNESYDTIKNLLAEGKTKASKVRADRDERIQSDVDALMDGWKDLDTIKDSSTIKQSIKDFANNHLSFEDQLHLLTLVNDRDKSDAIKKVVKKVVADNNKAYQKTRVDNYNMMDDLGRVTRDIYGEDVYDTFSDLETPIAGTAKLRMRDTSGHIPNNGIDITKGGIIQTYLTVIQDDYAWLLQPYNDKNGDEQWYLPQEYQGNGQGYKDKLKSYISADDFKLIAKLQESMDNAKSKTIDVSKEVLGVDPDLTKENYYPARFVADKSGLAERIDTVNIVAGFLNPRVSHRRTPDFDTNFVSTYIDTMEEAIRFENYSKWIQDTRGIFGKREVRKMIINKFGESFDRQLNEFITDIAKGRGRGEHMALLDKTARLFTTLKLGGNFSIFMGQLASVATYPLAEEGKITDAFNIFKVNNYKYVKKIWNDPRMMARRSQGQSQIVNDILDAKITGKKGEKQLQQLIQMAMIPNLLGDSLAISVAGSGVYGRSFDSAMAGKIDAKMRGDEKLSHEYAMDTLMQATESSQQSSDIAHLSWHQRRGGSFGRLLGMFSNTLRQLLSKQVVAGMEFAHFKDWESFKKFGKTTAINNAVLPILYVFLKRAYSWVAYDDEGAFWDEAENKRTISAILQGAVGGIIFYDTFLTMMSDGLVNGIYDKMLGEGNNKKPFNSFGSNVLPISGLVDDTAKMANLMAGLFDADVDSVGDFIKLMETAPAFKAFNRRIIEQVVDTKYEKKRKRKEKSK